LNKNDIKKLQEMTKKYWEFKYEYWIWLYKFDVISKSCKIDIYKNWQKIKTLYFNDWKIHNV